MKTALFIIKLLKKLWELLNRKKKKTQWSFYFSFCSFFHCHDKEKGEDKKNLSTDLRKPKQADLKKITLLCTLYKGP